MTKQDNIAYIGTLKKQFRHEWSAVEGTYKKLQERTDDCTIISLVDAIIQHSKEMGIIEEKLRHTK